MCTGVFAGHNNPVTSLEILSSPTLFPLLCPNADAGEDDVGTMLISSCKDGSICVYDAFDARNSDSKRDLDSSENSEEIRRKREAMWEIELNDGAGGTGKKNRDHRSSSSSRTGVTSLTTLNIGTLMAAGTTDGQIRLWNVSSGLYEGAYNLGRVQIWALGILSEEDVAEEFGDYGDGMKIHSAGIIVAGDNRGRIRILRKMSTRNA